MLTIRFLRNTKRNNQKYKKMSNTSQSLMSRRNSPQGEEVLCRGAEFSEKMLEDCLEPRPSWYWRIQRKKGLSDTDANSLLTNDKSSDGRVLSSNRGIRGNTLPEEQQKIDQNSVSLSEARCGKRRDFSPIETFATWWWTGRQGVLQFMGLQRVGHDWATELNWKMFFRKNGDPRRNTYDTRQTAQEKCKVWKELLGKSVIKSHFWS